MEVEAKKPDFSGWATKAGLRCSDGRTIMPDAFKHQDQARVPLVWQHNHNAPENVLGYAVLEHRDDGVYAYGFFNETETAKHARVLVQHEDITSLSIYANQLVEKSKKVMHGVIRELSLVLSGANPGALIDNVQLAHSDDPNDLVTLTDEAVIYSGLELEHSSEDSEEEEDLEHADLEEGPTVQEVYDGMTDEQKSVVAYLVGAALEDQQNGSMAQSSMEDETDEDDGQDDGQDDDSEGDEEPDSSEDLAHTDDAKGRRMTRNVFDQTAGGTKEEHVLSHDDMRGIVQSALKKGSLKDAVQDYALQHGIDNIDVLFPDAKNVTDTPEFDQRRVEWVSRVLSDTRHSPFSRIKSLVADITFDEARARGYIKGNMKKEEWFGVSKRTTTPTTVYKKQKLDRDDILDITDFDVVVWLKAEMRLMLDEEIARAVLIGDGRDVDDEDKIKDPQGAAEGAGIRSILHDHDLYAATVTVASDATPLEIADEVVGSIGFYKGSGSPTFYTTLPQLTSMLVERNATTGQRYWRTASELASELGVKDVETVEVMEAESDLIGIIVNLKDYTLGADRGGDVALFDDFDIDYNQYKYLLVTRVSGALTKIRSALVVSTP